jgi:alkylation response protein AidB-like acyl-CoA dehydrogenase
MIDVYGLDESAGTWKHRAATFAADVGARYAATVDTEARFPSESMAALAQGGFYGLCMATSFGGQGQGPATFAAVVEELARHCSSTAMVYVMHVAAAKMIEASTTLQAKADVLRAIADGQRLTTLALSERGSRSQFWSPVSQLVEQGNSYETHAFKSWATAAHHADWYVSSAQCPGAQSPTEFTLYLLPRTRSGVQHPETFNGLGLRGNDLAEDLLTEQGKGLACALQVGVPWFNIGTAAMAHGLCLATLEATTRHLQGTGFAHTGTGLRDLPTLRARLAEMSVATEQSRALLGHTLREMASPDAATPLWVLRTRMAGLQAAVQVIDLAMKVCGGAAFSRHLGIERLFRDARAGWVMAPTVDHLADFIGRALTGLPLL